MTTNQKIEASREIRQWIKGVIVPTVVAALYLDYRYPNLKRDAVNYISSKFQKEGENK